MNAQHAVHDVVPAGPGIVEMLKLSWRLPRRGDAAFDDLFGRYGDVVRVPLSPLMSRILPGGSGMAFLRDPALIKPLLTASEEVINTTQANRVWEMLWGDRSLFLLDGPPHRRFRKLLLPRLRGEALTQWRELIVSGAERETNGWADEPSVAVHPRMLNLSLSLILKVVLSVPDSAMPQWKPAWHELLHAAASGQIAIRFVLRSVGGMRVWPRFQRALRKCNRLVYEEIARRRLHPELEHHDLLDLLMHADGEPLSDNEIRDQVFAIIIGGYDPPATLVSWAIERLVRTPNALAASTAEARGGDEQMTYLNAVVQETLRLRPPFAYLGRLTLQPLTLGEHHFPAGTFIVPVIQSVHRHQDLYENPESFRPERFLQQRPATYEQVPFGGGPHRCIGDRLAIFEAVNLLATVLRSVDLAAIDPRDEPVLLKSGVHIPGNGARVRASRAV